MTNGICRHVVLVAGEPSGDALGARLMDRIRTGSSVPVRFTGVGGPLMKAEGLETLFPMEDLTAFGLAEVVPKLPMIAQRLSWVARTLLDNPPDIVVTIDAQEFSYRLARRLKGRTFPLVHYVAPTVWAWKLGRARKLAKVVDRVLALLPFEPPYFEATGLRCDFVGHPVIESGADKGDATRFRNRYGFSPSDPILCLLPGSRRGEVERLLPVFLEAADQLIQYHPGLKVIIPTVAAVSERVKRISHHAKNDVLVLETSDTRYDAFSASSVALAASGTVGLELALAGVPHVLAYKLNPITGWVARRVLTIKHVGMVNIILGTTVIPELLMQDCTAKRLTVEANRLLSDHSASDLQRQACLATMEKLGYGQAVLPSEHAARAVLNEMAQNSVGQFA